MACTPSPESTDATSTASGAGGGGGGGGGGSGGLGSATSSGDVGGEEPTCPSLGDACSTCLAAQCQRSYCACYMNPECQATTNCFLGCAPDDAACFQHCLTAHRDGISDVSLLGDCEAARCQAQCSSGKPLTPCKSCLFTRCPDEMNTCIANAQCSALLACVEACAGNAGCTQACNRNHSSGVSDAEPVLGCGDTRCDALCR